MVDFATIGSFASGLGSLASGLGFGSKKGKGLGEQLSTNLRWKKQEALDLPTHVVRGAKKAGLSPLTVMGMSPSYGPTITAGGSKGVDLEQFGQGVDRALNAGRNSVQRKLDEAALEHAQLSNDYLRTQIAGAQKAITRSGATPPIRSTEGETHVRTTNELPHSDHPHTGDSGRSAGNPPGVIRYDLGRGTTIELPYSAEGPAESMEALPFGISQAKFIEMGLKRGYARVDLHRAWQRYKKHERKVRNKRTLGHFKKAYKNWRKAKK